MPLNQSDATAAEVCLEPISALRTFSARNFRQSAHLEYIDGLRALAALFVVAHHIFGTVTGYVPNSYDVWLNYGHFSVGVFITLSGYCLMLPVARQNDVLRGGARGFFARRARRILPAYYAALALSILFIVAFIGHKTGSEWDASLPLTWPQVMAHLLLVQDFAPAAGALNYPCWSIAVECQIYLLFPLLVACWRKWGAYAGTAVGLALGIALQHLLPKQMLTLTLPWYVGLFSFGMLGAWLTATNDPRGQAMRARIPWGILALAATACVVIFCIHFGPSRIGLHIAIADYFVGIATASLLVAMAEERNAMLRRVFSWKPLVAIGTFAYSIYLMHAPLVQILWQYGVLLLPLSAHARFLVMEFAGLPLVVAFCYPFFLLFEKPFLVTRKNETLQQVATDAAESPAP